MSGKKNSTILHCVRRYDWIRRTLLDGNSINCTEIADRLGISVKTAQRYINTLRREGYDITYMTGIRGFVISRDEKGGHDDKTSKKRRWNDDGGTMTNWQRLIKRYAEGRTICNCGDAYLSPNTHGFAFNEEGVLTERFDLPGCGNGCSANQLAAKEYIAKKVLAELKKRASKE